MSATRSFGPGDPSGTATPAITAVIPTYNRPDLIVRAIESVQKQTWSGLRISVYDNSPGDETEVVVRNLMKSDPRITYHHHSENIGVVPNWQYGLERVETEFFAFLTDDDWLMPGLYEAAISSLREHPDAVFAIAPCVVQDEDSRLHDVIYRNEVGRLPPGLYRPPDGLVVMLQNTYQAVQSMICRRSFIDQVGGLDEKCSPLVDLDQQVRAAATCTYVALEEPGVVLVNSDATNANRVKWGASLPGLIENLNKLDLPAEVRDLAEVKITRWVLGPVYVAGLIAIRRKNLADARTAVGYLRNQPHGAAPLAALLSLTIRLRWIPRIADIVELLTQVPRPLINRLSRRRNAPKA